MECTPHMIDNVVDLNWDHTFFLYDSFFKQNGLDHLEEYFAHGRRAPLDQHYIIVAQGIYQNSWVPNPYQIPIYLVFGMNDHKIYAVLRKQLILALMLTADE